MFSDLANSWPPVAGPDQGYKHISTEISEDYIFGLQKLHKGAWWTGFYIATPEPNIDIQVVLRRSGGSIAFDTAIEQCKWTPNRSSWYPFPWPIPAEMADEMGLYLDISVSAITHISIKASFYELRGQTVEDSYLFTMDNSIKHTWNNAKQIIVPTMIELIMCNKRG